MADSRTVSGTITVPDNSRERVALELAFQIERDANVKQADRDRKWWLTLYQQCLAVVKAGDAATVLGRINDK